RLTSLQDLPSDKTLLRYIRKAAELNAAGVKAPRERAKPSEKRQIGVPDFLATALSQNKQAKGNFEKFSYSHKKEYIQWLVEAKREETRQKRLQTALAWIAQGKPQNWKYMRAKSLLPALFGLFLCSAAHAADSSAEKFWPQWRGPLGTGVAPHADPPLTWSETNHVKWKLPIPGEGDSTPVVWGSRVFILSAVPVGEDAAASAGKEKGLGPFRFTVICVDRSEGKVVWQKVARETAPHEGRQENNTFASASPVTDGQLLWAFFGSRGLHCYDFDGNLKWEKDFGQMKTKMGFGEGASPALSGDTLIINWDHEGD